MDTPTQQAHNQFDDLLKRHHKHYRRVWLMALLNRFILPVLGIGVIYAVIDYSFALENGSRIMISGGLCFLFLIVSALGFYRIFKRPITDTAQLLDQESAPLESRYILTTYEFLHSQTSEKKSSPLSIWLTEETLKKAHLQWDKLSKSPEKRNKRLVRLSLLPSAIIILNLSLFIIYPHAMSTIAGRLLMPWLDVPPLSTYTFTLENTPLHVIYGDNITLKVKITGDEPKSPVDLMIKSPGLPLQKLTTFNDSKEVWARRLEKMTSPCEIAFFTDEGRARTHWYPITILYEPKILSGKITVSPPDYINQKSISYPLGNHDTTVIAGGSVTYELQSNYPLMGGTALFTPTLKDLPVFEIKGYPTQNQGITFSLPAKYSGTVSINVSDFQGTSMRQPLVTALVIRPDQRPSASISHPESHGLALPDSIIPFHGEVQDDYGLSHVSWVRKINKHRARPLTLPLKANEKILNITEQIHLNNLGVIPGDLLEFSIEARDSNPHVLNIAGSDIVTLKIISEDEYREVARIQTELADFLNRYQALTQSIKDTIDALEEKAQSSAPLTKEQWDELKTKHRTAQDMAQNLAKDFPIFASDPQLSKMAKKVADTMAQNIKDLEKTAPKPPRDQQKLLTDLKERLAPSLKESEESQDQAEIVGDIISLYKLLAEFKALALKEESISKQIINYQKELSEGRPVSREMISSIGHIQSELKDKLNSWFTAIRNQLDKLPQEADSIKKEGEQFLQAAHEGKFPQGMGEVAEKCEQNQPSSAQLQADQIAQAMLKLFDTNPMTKSCSQGNCLSLPSLTPAMQQTMQQMMQSLLCSMESKNPGTFPGFGTSIGFGSGSGSGTATDTQGLIPNLTQIPLMGPKNFQPPRQGKANGREGKNGSSESGKGSGEPKVHVESNPNKNEPSPDKHSESSDSLGSPEWQQIPASYRDAVREYFRNNE